MGFNSGFKGLMTAAPNKPSTLCYITSIFYKYRFEEKNLHLELFTNLTDILMLFILPEQNTRQNEEKKFKGKNILVQKVRFSALC